MALKSRIRVKPLSAALVGWMAFALIIPSGAWAGSDSFGFSWNHHRQHDDRGGYNRDSDHRRGHDNRHGSKRDSRNYHHDRHRYDTHVYGGHPRDSHHSYGHHATRYFCRSCNHHFSSHAALRHHVGGHHHVPFWRLSDAIGYTSLGFIFQL